MRAWGRVREIEIKKDEVEEKIHSKKATGGDDTYNSDSDEEVGLFKVTSTALNVLFQLNEAEMDEFLDWRQKKT